MKSNEGGAGCLHRKNKQQRVQQQTGLAAKMLQDLRESAQRCAQEEPHTNHLSCLAQPLLSGHCELPQRGANPTQIIDIIS